MSHGSRVVWHRFGMANGRTTRKSGYQRKNKRVMADRYGTYVAGRLVSPENIAGRAVSAQLKGTAA